MIALWTTTRWPRLWDHTNWMKPPPYWFYYHNYIMHLQLHGTGPYNGFYTVIIIIIAIIVEWDRLLKLIIKMHSAYVWLAGWLSNSCSSSSYVLLLLVKPTGCVRAYTYMTTDYRTQSRSATTHLQTAGHCSLVPVDVSGRFIYFHGPPPSSDIFPLRVTTPSHVYLTLCGHHPLWLRRRLWWMDGT